MANGWKTLPPIYTKTFAINEFYDGAPDWPYPTGVVQIAEPAVTAKCAGEMEPGTRVRVRLVSSDIATREIHLELVG